MFKTRAKSCAFLYWEISQALERYSEEEFLNLGILNSLTKDVEYTDEMYGTVLEYAAGSKDHQIIRILLNNGFDVHSKNMWDVTLLHVACTSGDAKCIQTVLNFKPDINAQDKFFITPLHRFLYNPPEDELPLKALLDAGANTNSVDIHGHSPLGLLALVKETEKTEIFAQMLIDHNADVNYKRNDRNETVLHLALYNMKSSLVRVLLENGACINGSDVHPDTNPMRIALALRIMNPSTFAVMLEHFTMRYCCGYEISQEYLDKVREMEIFKNFKETWDPCLLLLQKQTIGRSPVTFYDILVSPANKIANYLYNPDILHILQNFDINDNVAGRYIKRKFEEGLKVHKAVKMGKYSCMKLMKLTELGIDRLIEYLSVDDLRNLSELFNN